MQLHLLKLVFILNLLALQTWANVYAPFQCLVPENSTENRSVLLSPLTGLAVGNYPFEPQANKSNHLLKPFTSDGCSLSPDSAFSLSDSAQWVHCCYDHDRAYWLGGSLAEKELADLRLQQCISETGFQRIAKIYQWAVNRLGGPDSPSSFRWGYGWTSNRKYSPLSKDELTQVEMILKNSDFKGFYTNPSLSPWLCIFQDPSLGIISNQESKIFQFLNQSLKTTGKIIWAFLDEKNQKNQVYQIRLSTCEDIVKIQINSSLEIKMLEGLNCL